MGGLEEKRLSDGMVKLFSMKAGNAVMIRRVLAERTARSFSIKSMFLCLRMKFKSNIQTSF